MGAMPTKEQRDHLYESYVKPLEAEHWGEFAGVTLDGKVTLGGSVHEVLTNSNGLPKTFKVIFKVGERVVGHIR